MRVHHRGDSLINYFPVSLAEGAAFCNRTVELKRLHYNLEHNISTLLVSPRRYGKTSLALQAMRKLSWPFVHIDLYKALNEEDIAHFVLNGVGQLLASMESTPEKLIKIATEFFSGFQLKFAIEKMGLSVEFNRQERRPVDIILAALERIDNFLVNKKQQAIIFLDEFQVLAEVAPNHSIEAAIREAVQKSKAIRYVFSGSQRHLIESMFNDRNRPFYNLCDQMTIQRISNEHYQNYINKAAQVHWQCALDEAVIHEVLTLTENHSYFLNKLCSLLWQQEQLPTRKDVEETWQIYTLENQSRVEQEISLLTTNQRKLLINLAKAQKVKEPTSKHWALQWQMSSTSIHRSLEALLLKDYAFIDEQQQYRVLDPLLKAVLS